MIVGGYIPCEIGDAGAAGALTYFREILAGLTVVETSCNVQVVAGTNYKFGLNIIDPSEVSHPAEAVVHVSLDNQYSLLDLEFMEQGSDHDEL